MGGLTAPELGDPAYHSALGVHVDPLGNIYVTDIGLHRVVKFAQSGGYLTHWGSQGSSPGSFDEPYDVAADGNGFIYIVDRGNGRVQKFADASQVDVGNRSEVLGRARLLPARPNPAATEAVFGIDLPASSQVSLTILDTKGRVVRRPLQNRELGKGLSRWTWNLRDEGGRRVAPGVYFARMEIQSEALMKKIVVE